MMPGGRKAFGIADEVDIVRRCAELDRELLVRRCLAIALDHLAREPDQLGAAAPGRPRALGDLDQLADHVTPAQLLLQDVKEVIAAIAV